MPLPKEFELKRFVRNGVDYEFNFHCENAYLLSAFREADRVKDKSLDMCFERLKVIAKNYNGYVNIFKDWANLSFAFSITEKNVSYQLLQDDYGRIMLHGGIIFHGHDGVRENNLTCTLDDDPQGWRIHT